MMRPKATHWTAAAVTLALHATAQAQSGREELARRELIERAEAAQTAGNHAEALRLGTQAASIRQHPSLRLFLAGEHQQLNHLVEALAEARACVREAENDASLRNRARIRAACAAIVTAVEPRIGRVQVQVEPALPDGAVVHVGEEEVRPSLLGAPLPVSPGDLRVRIEAPGFEPFSTTITVAPQQQVVIPVRLTALPEAPPPAPTPAVEATTTVAPTVAPTPTPAPALPPPAPATRTGPGAGPWVLMGVGAAALVGGVVGLAASSSAEGNVSEGCLANTTTCTAEENGHLDDSDTYSTLGAVGLLVGVGALAGGIVWYAVAPRGPRAAATHAPNWRLGAVPTRGGFGLSYGLTF